MARAVFNDSARSGGKASDVVTSICPSSVLGSGGPDGFDTLDSRDSSGSGVVAELSSLGARYFARSGVPSALLEQGISLAQVSPQLDLWSDASDVGWGLISEEVTFGLWSCEELALSISARELLSCRESSSLCSANFELHGGRVRGQFYSDCLPLQPRGHSISAAQLHFSAHPAVGGVSSSSIGSAIHRGSQRHSGFPIQT